MMERMTFSISLVVLGIYILVGVFAPLIATKYPYKLEVNDKTYYPAFEHFLSFYHLKKGTVLNQPDVLNALEKTRQGGLVAFEPSFIDLGNTRSKPPGTPSQETHQIHLLGTDDLGRDLLSNLIHGTLSSMSIAFSSVSLALIIAIFIALPCSYIGDKTLKFTRINLTFFITLMIIVSVTVLIVRPFYSWYDIGPVPRIILVLFCGVLLAKVLGTTTLQTQKTVVSFPLDSIMMRVIEFMKSLPKLLILFVIIAASTKMSPPKLSAIIALLIWPTFYRYIRASILEQKHSTLFESLQNLGYTDTRILIVHFLPKTLRTVMIPFVFSLISVVLFEATLSFLGIGLSSSYVSWGKVLSEARNNISAWWLAVFPGLVIFVLVLVLNRIGDFLIKNWS